MACRFCDNSTTNPELDHTNDLSYMGIGDCEDGYTIFFKTGDSRPTTILFEDRRNLKSLTHLAGYYIPKYCPECGRELVENKKVLEDGKRINTDTIQEVGSDG